MKNIPRDIVLKKWDELPESIKEAVFSPEYGDVIVAAGEKRGLNEFQNRILLALTGDVLMGFEKPFDLPLNISTELKIDPGLASAISQEIDALVFLPLRSELQEVSRIETSKLIQRVSPTEMPAEITREKLQPTFKDDSPFIIHAEEEMKTAASGVSRRDLVRPSFYQPATEEKIDSSNPVVARVEVEGLARESGKAAVPLTARTTMPQPRVVHYSDFKTPLDPFGKASTESSKEDKKPEVHPDNIINLKDLPK